MWSWTLYYCIEIKYDVETFLLLWEVVDYFNTYTCNNYLIISALQINSTSLKFKGVSVHLYTY